MLNQTYSRLSTNTNPSLESQMNKTKELLLKYYLYRAKKNNLLTDNTTFLEKRSNKHKDSPPIFNKKELDRKNKKQLSSHEIEKLYEIPKKLKQFRISSYNSKQNSIYQL